MTSASYYVHWGVVQISLTNMLIIVGMIVLFILALVIPFPKDRHGTQSATGQEDADGRS
jgi:hypothetical protein